MNSTDITVFRQLLDWCGTSHQVWLVTVLKTYGSSPRQPGAMLALRDDGLVVGSVSGGCIEDDLVYRVQQQQLVSDKAQVEVYGATAEEQRRFQLPCGGTLELLIEPVSDTEWISSVLNYIDAHRLVQRKLDLATLAVAVQDATSQQANVVRDEQSVSMVYGPRWRMLIIGAGETSSYLASMAVALDYQVYVCDPREEMQQTWQQTDSQLLNMMPDDAVNWLEPDVNTAIVALTHDPKLDDMALIEALKSPAFYVGALGSQRTNANRRERLALFDLTVDEIARLHGPVGLAIGSRRPAEIAVSILAELIALRQQRVAKKYDANVKVIA